MVCFVMIRHINSIETNKYWMECYKRVRKYYPTEKILIVDSNSNYNYVTDLELINAIVIKSEFSARGEILGYYYYYKSDILDDAVIIQDGMFINNKIDFGSESKFLWHFDSDCDESELVKEELTLLNNNVELLNFYNDKKLWKGCFAGCSIIKKELIETLDKKYNFFNLLNVIKTQNYARAFERAFAVIFLFETNNNINSCSLFGSIFDYIKKYPKYKWGFSYENFINLNFTYIPLIKIWSRR